MKSKTNYTIVMAFATIFIKKKGEIYLLLQCVKIANFSDI
jgi:hypothetical protein